MLKFLKRGGGNKGVTVGQKILAVVGLCIALLIVVAVTGVVQMQRVGSEITEIAQRDIPIIEIISAITTHQLEQAVNFERALRYGEEMEHSEEAAAHFTTAVTTFEELAHKVDEEIKEGEHLAEGAIAAAPTAESRAEFEHVLAALKTIEKEHADFDTHANHIIELLAEGDVFEAIEGAEAVEAEEEQLNHELEALLVEVEKFTETSAKAAEEHEKFGIMLMTIVSATAAVGGFALAAWVVRRSVTRPLTEVVTALNGLATGDTSVTVEVRSNDEVGQLAKAFGEFKEKTIEAQRLAEERVEQERQVEEDKRNALLGLADNLENGVKGVVDAVSSGAAEMQSAAESMSATSEETSRQSQAAAAAAEQASSNVQTVSSAAEEMSSSVNEIARQVAQSAGMAKAAVDEARKTNESVQGLAESSQKIGEVVNIISDIASQTNLLALNATIEAARAGDAGKGFAVVASEVKSLANQTAKATEEIAAQIGSIQSATEESVGAIGGIGKKIGEMDEISTAIASAIEEQGAATGEISNNSQQAAAGTQEVSANISSVNQAAAETGAAASQVLQSAGDLSKQAEMLRAEVDKFLAEVGAA